MIAVGGTYKDGQVNLDKKYTAKNPVKVIVTFLEDVAEEKDNENRLSMSDFSFSESRKALEHYKGSFSDAVIEERRSAV